MVGVLEPLARLDAEEDLVGRGLAPVQVMGVPRGHRHGPGARAERSQRLEDALLLRQAVVHELDEEAVPARELHVEASSLVRRALVPREQVLRHLPVEAGRAYRESPAVSGEDFPVDPGAVVEALQIPDGGEPAEIAVAFGVLRQECQMEVRGAAGNGIPVIEPGRGQVGFHADDGLDALGRQLVIELDGAEEAAMIRDGGRGHALLHGAPGQVPRPDGAVEEAVLRVEMQMYEFLAGWHQDPAEPSRSSAQAACPDLFDSSAEPYFFSNARRSSSSARWRRSSPSFLCLTAR